MRRLLVILFSFFITHWGYGEEQKNNTLEQPEKRKSSIPKNNKKEEYEYYESDTIPISLIISPCFNFKWTSGGELKDRSTSFWSSFNIIKFQGTYDYQIANSHFFCSFGLGYTNQDFSFSKSSDQVVYTNLHNEKVGLVKGEEIVYKVADIPTSAQNENNIEIKNCYLFTHYLELPLEFSFIQNPKYYKEGFFITLGGKLGFSIISPSVKVVYIDKTDEKNHKSRSVTLKEDLGLSLIKLTATARIGYGRFGIYLDWGFLNMFNSSKMENKQDMLKPFSVGFSFNLF